MGNDRHYGLDIARILAMFLVVLFHCVRSFSGFVDSCVAGRVLGAVSGCCVDLFALLSGYVGVKARFRPSRFAALWVQMVFTGFVVVFGGMVCGLWQPTLKDWGKVVAPVSGHAYWYMTSYFLLFLLMPLLNAGLRSLSKRMISILVAALCLFVVVLPAFNPYGSDTYVLGGGFSPIWLILCYVIGGGYRVLDRIDSGAFPWLLASILLVALNCFWTGSYAHPSILALAMSVLIMCTKIKITSLRAQKVIAFFSSAALGVYLWHVQPLLYVKLTGCLRSVCRWPRYEATLALLSVSAAVYLVVAILEHGRMWLFGKIGIDRVIRKVDTLCGV